MLWAQIVILLLHFVLLCVAIHIYADEYSHRDGFAATLVFVSVVCLVFALHICSGTYDKILGWPN